MGRSEKAANLKVQSGGKNKGCVSEATISKLLNDFSCTRFLTNGGKTTNEECALSSEQEFHDANYAEIVTSLKHLHLKKPTNRRNKRKEKKDIQQRTKYAIENKYNLAVAATSQQSVLLPGKLSNIACGLRSSEVILQPSKLSTSLKWEKRHCSPSLSSSHHISSSDEKTRIANTLSNQNLSLFKNPSKNFKTSTLSFSQLCKNSKSSDNCTNRSALHKYNGSHDSDSLPPHSCQIHHFDYRNCSTQSTSGNAEISNNHTQCCNNLNTSCCAKTSSNSLSSSQEASFSNQLDSLTSGGANCVYETCLGKPTSAIVASTSTTSVSSGVFPERSCSEEMRMEESNVNELASYFEDLLHIPRKMSVMAEMMYA